MNNPVCLVNGMKKITFCITQLVSRNLKLIQLKYENKNKKKN